MIPLPKIAAAAVLTLLAGGPREFGIGGGAILCVPEADIDADATPYAPNPKQLQAGGTAFAFQFAAAEVRRHVPGFAVDPELADLRAANTLSGTVGFADEAGTKPAGVVCRPRTLGPGRALSTCTRATRIDGFRVDYEIEERNAGLVMALDEFLRGKIAAWRDNCHATDRM